MQTARRLRDEIREQLESLRILAGEFALERGWMIAGNPFTVAQLARCSNKIRRELPAAANLFLDGAVYFRHPWRPYRPAAIAVHVFGWPEMGPDIDGACREAGLRYEAVSGFPAWISGGQLIVYTPVQECPEPALKTKKRKAEGQWWQPDLLDWREPR